jgi:V-type H+-transporting ATPase 16kDa proteolipid subunit
MQATTLIPEPFVLCDAATSVLCTGYDPVSYSFFGWMGVAAAVVLANFGSAYGTAKSGIGIGPMAVTRPTLVYKALIPVVMAGILGIYGLIVAVIMITRIKMSGEFGHYQGYKLLAGGLCCGFSCLASGYAIGIVGEVGVRSYAINEDFYVGLILILIFGEAIGLFGLIVAILMAQIGEQSSG